MRTFVPSFGLFAVLCAISTPAYAYLDPGTGSILLQGLIAGIATFGTVISLNYQRFKAKFRGFFGKAGDDNPSK